MRHLLRTLAKALFTKPDRPRQIDWGATIVLGLYASLFAAVVFLLFVWPAINGGGMPRR